jgi:hypothetical protein
MIPIAQWIHAPGPLVLAADVPAWWINASGLFAILGSVAMIAITILAGVLIWVSLDLLKQLRALSVKIDALSTKASIIAANVQSITEDVSLRTKTVGAMVDDGSAKAYGFVEKAAPVLVVAGILFRLARAAGFVLGRKKGRGLRRP